MKFITHWLCLNNKSHRFIKNIEGSRPEEIESMSPAETAEHLTTAVETQAEMRGLLAQALLEDMGGEITDQGLRNIARAMLVERGERQIRRHDVSRQAEALRTVLESALSADAVAVAAPVAAETSVETTDYAGIARAVNGLSLSDDGQHFILEGSYGRSFNIEAPLIGSAEDAQSVVTEYQRLLREGYLDIDGEDVFYLTSLDADAPTHELEAIQLQAILGLDVGDVDIPQADVAASEAPAAVLPAVILSDETEALIDSNLNPEQAALFRTSIEGVGETEVSARLRILSILQNYHARIESGEVVMGGHNQRNTLRRLEGVINQLVGGDMEYDNSAVVSFIDAANALSSGISLTAEAADDGIEATQLSPEVQAQLTRARTFVENFLEFRPNQDALASEAIQAINNGDLEPVTALINTMLDRSIRSNWFNMYGSDEYETGDLVTREHGRNGELTSAETRAFTPEAILGSDSVLAQALRELNQYEAAESQMLAMAQEEMSRSAQLSRAGEIAAALNTEETPSEAVQNILTAIEAGNLESVTTLLDEILANDSRLEGQNFSAATVLTSPDQVTQIITLLGQTPEAVESAERAFMDNVRSRIESANQPGSPEYQAAQQRLEAWRGADPIGYEQKLEEEGGEAVMITNLITTVSFTATMREHLEDNTAAESDMPHIMNIYQDMTGISPEWDWSDQTWDSVYNNLAITIATLPISFVAVARAGSMLRGALGINTPRGAAVVRAAAENSTTQMAKVGATVGFSPNTLNAFRISLNNLRSPSAIRQSLQRSFAAQIDDGARIITNFSDETLETIARAARRPGNRLNEALNRAVQVTRTQLDEAGRVVANTVDEVLPAAATVTERSMYNLGLNLGRIQGLSTRAVQNIVQQTQRLGRAALRTADDLAARAAARSALLRTVQTLPRAQQFAVASALGTAGYLVAPDFSDIFFGSPAQAATTDPAPVRLEPSALPTVDLGGDGVPTIDTVPAPLANATDTVDVPEPLTLDQQMEAITSSEIRSHATEIRAVLANHTSYTPGDWQQISNEIAEIYGLELATEEDRIDFGHQIQSQIKNTLGMADSEEDLSDGKIGRETMQHLDRAMMSVSVSEIEDRAEDLQNFDSQPNWRDNNRGLAQLFGINFPDDASDTQLKVFGRSVQVFAGGNDGAIGSRTMARLNERLAALSDA